ncbi:MAG TPA: hypothetical protein VK155_19315 [Bacteroidales bacterium]|jgi:hypothetical protein|nr:hypothetical protein [Bacteroidales bacterium]
MKKILHLCIAALISFQAIAQTQTATLKSAARLFGEKNDLTTVLMIIPSGSAVQVLDAADSTYYRVMFEENEGYIFKRQAVIDKTPAKIASGRNDTSQESAATDNQQVQQNTRSRFSYLEEKYGTSLAARINSGKIWKGMTPEMVKDSWGSPQKINRLVNGNTMNEQWTYQNTILYFKDNQLTEWGPARK